MTPQGPDTPVTSLASPPPVPTSYTAEERKALLTITPPYWPELLTSVKLRVEEILVRFAVYPRVLELGSGHSTLWLAGMSDLTSIEHDQAWFDAVRGELRRSARCAEVWLEHEGSFPSRVSAFPDGCFDLAYIDCVDSQRLPCLKEVLPKLKSHAVVVLDDTHWDLLAPALEVLPEDTWSREVFSGEHLRHTGKVHYHHTTIFTRS